MKSIRNKKIAIIQVVFLSLYLFTTGFSFASAQTSPCPTGFSLSPSGAVCLPNTGYTVLAPLPGTTAGDCTTSDPNNPACQSTLSKYLPGIFNLMIGVGAIAAFVVITIFGFEYMLTDSLVSKQNARTWVENALWGLGLIIFAYAILHTINPALVNGTLNISAPNTTSGGSLISSGTNPCGGTNQTACTTELSAEQALLSSPNITINGQTNYQCTQTSCPTQVGGLTASAISGVEALQAACNCTVNITGGSETSGHTTNTAHASGSVVDVSATSAIDQALINNTAPPQACYTNTTTVGGQTATILYEPTGSTCGGTVPSGGNHWHIKF